MRSRAARAISPASGVQSDATCNTLRDESVSIREAARKIGLNVSTLSRQVRNGSIRSHDGKVRLSEVLQDRAADVDWRKARGRRGAAQPTLRVDGVEMTLYEARAIRETYAAKLLELEFQVKSGKLVDAEAVRNSVFKLSREFRDALQNWPAQVAPLIAAEFNVNGAALAASLDEHIRRFLLEQSTALRDAERKGMRAAERQRRRREPPTSRCRVRCQCRNHFSWPSMRPGARAIAARSPPSAPFRAYASNV